ncbi:MAG TPA: hypothetical protein VGM51_02515 [Armatimonadota bacterium]|jgi:hypothetical protein
MLWEEAFRKGGDGSVTVAVIEIVFVAEPAHRRGKRDAPSGQAKILTVATVCCGRWKDILVALAADKPYSISRDPAYPSMLAPTSRRDEPAAREPGAGDEPLVSAREAREAAAGEPGDGELPISDGQAETELLRGRAVELTVTTPAAEYAHLPGHEYYARLYPRHFVVLPAIARDVPPSPAPNPTAPAATAG